MMKRVCLLTTAILLCFSYVNSQISEGGIPKSFNDESRDTLLYNQVHQKIVLQNPDITLFTEEDFQNDSLGKPYRIGVKIPVNLNPENAGTWIDFPDGSKMWRLSISVKNAKALGLYFSEDVIIPDGAKLFVYNRNKKQVLGAYTSSIPRFQAMEMVQGDYLTIEYYTEPEVSTLPVISIDNVAYFYRGVEEHINVFSDSFAPKADECQVDVACTPERNGWEDQINSVVHYVFSDGEFFYVCTASTINNTALDCKPYILSAWHCGERNAGSSIASWVWYWNYQKSTCQPSQNGSDPSKGTQTMTGGTVRASSGNGTLNNPPSSNEVAGSDFYLVELNSSIPASYNAFFAGWDRTNTSATSGVGVHHPAGSAKKISTYTSSLTSTTFNGGALNAHWRVVWAATTNGHGVTEGGSSGSPIFNQNGRIVGQLTGGSSSCSSPIQGDLYGKMSVNWDQNGTSNTARLKPWLDPINSNVTTLNGVYLPCTSEAPVTDFTASQTTASPLTTIDFTDLSTNNPTSWEWSVSPATGWSFAIGSNANSQNPQILFSDIGQYTISLTATNVNGSDTETKNEYIVISLISNLSENVYLINSVKIYPNPTSGKIFIDFEKTGMDNFEIGLYDMSGKLLFMDKLNAIKNYELDMSSFAIGFYQIKVVSGEATMISKVSKM